MIIQITYSFVILIAIILILIEISHQTRPNSPLTLKPYNWDVKKRKNNISLTGLLRIDNPHKRIEVMVPNLSVRVVPIGNKLNNRLTIQTIIIPHHINQESRNDDYWEAYIVKSKSHTDISIDINLDLDNNIEIELDAIWLEIKWGNYGPFGMLDCLDGFVIPIKKINNSFKEENWKSLNNGIKLLPIKTHILGRLDNPYDLLKEYSKSIIKNGDILTIGETPLAIMQGRYILPRTLKVNFLTRLLCRGFNPTSSLATACGMQSLINLVGPSRVICSWLIGGFLKIFRIKGIFYRLAGSQARLIDDITGTTPPYDQTIVLGPINVELFCEQASKELAINIAVVDVNDLGKVKILACNQGCDQKILKKALLSNPAGNANQHTPIVLVRP